MGARGVRTRALTAAAALTGLALLARQVTRGRPSAIDRRVRGVATRRPLRVLATALAPLFPIGFPGGFIPLAYLTAHWLRRRGRHGGRLIVIAAWGGWFAHRGAKVFYRRDRPRVAGRERRTDSFPSGHTTGITTLAIVAAHVFEREELMSPTAARLLRYGAPGLMGAYRVLADDHWITDVIGGWLLGAATASVLCVAADSSRCVRLRRR